VTWAAGIARSYVPVTLANPAFLGLFALAAWVGLRIARVDRGVTFLAIAALAAAPLLVTQLNTFTTDLPALTWIVTCAALCLAAVHEPRLLGVALLAAGLAVGTKTTTLPLAAGMVIATAFAVRGRTRIGAALLACAAGAAIIGGLWYLRNLFDHGSPFWPFLAAPWGDEQPFLFNFFSDRLLTDLGSISGRVDDYGRALWGCALLLAGGLAAPLWARSRAVYAASAVTAISVLIWAYAPNTAYPGDAIYDGLQASAVRYMLPAMAAATLALALSASRPGRGRYVGIGLLAGGLAFNLAGDARLGFFGDFVPAVAFETDPIMPSALVPLAGAAAGALAAAAVGAFGDGRGAASPGQWVAPAAMAGLAIAGGAALAVAAAGYVERSTALGPSGPAAAWLAREPAFADGDDPLISQGRIVGTLAGDRMRHDISLLEGGADCERVGASTAPAWTVINISVVPETPAEGGEPAEFAREIRDAELAAARCLRDREPVYDDGTTKIYPPSALTGTE
jgi:hypothetical protein